MDALLTPILKSPGMVRLAAQLQQAIAAERVARERFYEEVSPDDKWEFINGEVVKHMPTTIKHAQIKARIERVIFEYVDRHALGAVLGEKALVCFTRNDYEPDVIYFPTVVAEAFEDDQWKLPIPELIVEILSPSTEHLDRGVKRDDYAEHGVLEYWIVDPKTETIEQYLLPDGATAYGPSVKQSDGTLLCKAIEGFTMPVRAAFDDSANREARRAIRQD